jgi:dolichol kinase
MNAFKGTLGLVTAAVIVVVLLVAFPAYRWFFLISLGIGVAVWGILHLWHRSHPIEEKDVQDTKRPLGLS